MTDFLDYARERLVLFDGGMGSQIQGRNLTLDDFWGQENCSEILNLSRPDLVRDIHGAYLRAGADAVETNTFGGSPITLGEFGLAERAFEINKRACELAFEAIEQLPADGRRRFVVGSIGPGTRLPSLGHVAYRDIEDAFFVQAHGLVEGGAAAILIETCQDPLQIKAAVNGARRAFAKTGKALPLIVQVTIETTGSMLVGTDIAAATVIIDALDVPVIGLNCATGPKEMAEHLRHIGQTWEGLISVQPNAGLPELGRRPDLLSPRCPGDGALARALRHRGRRQFRRRLLRHQRDPHRRHRRHAAPPSEDGFRPRPQGRSPQRTPALASLFSAVPLRQENSYLSIGERCNANGSKRFRELQAAEDWDACVAMGREQAREGSNTLDVCTAYVGRDEVPDMTEVITRMRGQVDARW